MIRNLRLGYSVAVLLVFLILVPVLGEAKGAPVNVTVTQDRVTLGFQLDLSENLTSLPVANINLAHSNLSSVVGPINLAIEKLSPNARVQDLSLIARTFNVSGTSHLQENYTIVVAGANSNSGSSVAVDLSFLSMDVSDSITVGTVELNQVGLAYLLAPLLKEGQLANLGLLKVGWFIGGEKTLTPSIPEISTKGFSLLDFSWVPPISRWNEQQNLLGQSTTWNYNVAFPRFNLTYGPISPEQTLLTSFVAVYDPSLSLMISSDAFASGSTIQFDLPSPAEPIMPIAIVVSGLALLSTLLLDRRLTKPLMARRKKR